MWGISIDNWIKYAYYALIAGFVLGGFALIFTTFSAFISYKTADVIQEENKMAIAEARSKIEEAKRDAARATEHAAELEKQTAELQKEAEAAKEEAAKANERILKMQQMRSLQKSQAEALKQLFQSESFQKEPKPNLRLAAVADAEAQKYAWELQKFFESCGVNIYPTDGGLPTTCMQSQPDPNGMALKVKTLKNPLPALVNFQRLMHSVGLPMQVTEDPQLRDNEAMLYILRKPT